MSALLVCWGSWCQPQPRAWSTAGIFKWMDESLEDAKGFQTWGFYMFSFCVCTWVYRYTRRSEDTEVTHYFSKRVYQWPGAHWVSSAGWPVNLRDLLCFFAPLNWHHKYGPPYLFLKRGVLRVELRPLCFASSYWQSHHPTISMNSLS